MHRVRDRLSRFTGGEPTMIPAVAPDPMAQSAMPATEPGSWICRIAA